MSQNLLRYRETLTALGTTRNKSLLMAIIEAGDAGLIRAISECVCNILKARVKLTTRQIRTLRPFEKELLQLVDKRKSTNRRRSYNKQAVVCL